MQSGWPDWAIYWQNGNKIGLKASFFKRNKLPYLGDKNGDFSTRGKLIFNALKGLLFIHTKNKI